MGAVEEILLFLRACLLGAILAACYDVLRVFRLAVKCGTLVVFLQDILYFVLAALATFCFLLAWNDGRVRVYLLSGELVGAVAYFFTVSRLVMKFFGMVIRGIKRPFEKLFEKIQQKRKKDTNAGDS